MFNTKIWKHQKIGASLILKNKSYMLADDMGCGKSATALYVQDKVKPKNLLIICPKAVIPVWPYQISQHCTTNAIILAFTDNISVQKKSILFQKKVRLANISDKRFICIINYESAWRPPMGPVYNSKNIMTSLGSLIRHPWDMVILDESHNIKAPGGKASWFCTRLLKNIEWKILLTGTPIPNALSNDCPILTPSGWKRIDKIRINDMVIGKNGQPTKVVGVWPQGERQLYTIYFSDNTTIKCTADHLWQVQTRSRRCRKLLPLIRATIDLNKPERKHGKQSILSRDGAAHWHIPLVEPVQFVSQKLYIHPYILGVLLGDGYFGPTTELTTSYQQIINEIKRVLPAGIYLSVSKKIHNNSKKYRIISQKRGGSLKGSKRGPAPNPFTIEIERLGLKNHGAKQKFIPKQYLWNDTKHRIALLQGLCDTDGNSAGSTTRYSTISKQLAKDIQFLIQSLGGYVKTSIESSHFVTLPQGKRIISKPLYLVSFRININPFRLKHKHDKFKIPWRKPRRSIMAIVPADTQLATCITVEAKDGLYVTKDFLVTHNSPMDLYAQFRAMDISVFGSSFAAFRARYAIMGGYNNKQIIKYQNIDDLRKRFFNKARVVKKRDVLTLPPVQHIVVPCKLSSKATKLYKKFEKDFEIELSEGKITASNALVKLLRLQQITGGTTLTEKGKRTVIDTSKAEALESVMDGINKSEPIVVFARYTEDIRQIHKVCQNKKINRTSFELSGKCHETEKWQKAVTTEGAVLVAQIRTGKEGIDLTSSCYCIYYSIGFSPGEFDQSAARLDRSGQTKPVTYHHLICTGTVDEKIYKALRGKKSIIDSVIDQYKKKP